MRSEPGGEPSQRTRWQRFTQQRLRAWQPILAPCWIISIYNISGLVFICVGVGLLSASQSVTEYSHDYTDDADRRRGVGSFSIEIKQDMEPPIWIYYELDGFHQNHRRYVQSRGDEQLRDEAPRRYSAADLGQCKPWIAGEDGRPHYPCGLVARSVFNDTFALLVERSPESPRELLEVDSSAEAMAWSADAGQYRNVDPEAPAPEGAQNQHALNMWILERFPPVTCEQTVISEARPFAPVAVARRNESLADGRTVEVADCRGLGSGERALHRVDAHGRAAHLPEAVGQGGHCSECRLHLARTLQGQLRGEGFSRSQGIRDLDNLDVGRKERLLGLRLHHSWDLLPYLRHCVPGEENGDWVKTTG